MPVTTPHQLKVSDIVGEEIISNIASQVGIINKKFDLVVYIKTDDSKEVTYKVTSGHGIFNVKYEGPDIYKAIETYNSI